MENPTIVYNEENYSSEMADYVECSNCGQKMLLPCGADKCPVCGYEGTLVWVDDELQEVYVEEFLNEDDNHIYLNDGFLEETDYLSEEVLSEFV